MIARPPSLGACVLFRGRDNRPRAAVVVQVHGRHCVGLYVYGESPEDEEIGHHSSVTLADPIEEPGCFPSWYFIPENDKP